MNYESNIIYFFYTKSLYKNKPYDIILIVCLSANRGYVSHDTTVIRSVDLCFQTVTYHAAYKCVAKIQDTPLCENNNRHLASFCRDVYINVKTLRFYEFYIVEKHKKQ